MLTSTQLAFSLRFFHYPDLCRESLMGKWTPGLGRLPEQAGGTTAAVCAPAVQRNRCSGGGSLPSYHFLLSVPKHYLLLPGVCPGSTHLDSIHTSSGTTSLAPQPSSGTDMRMTSQIPVSPGIQLLSAQVLLTDKHLPGGTWSLRGTHGQLPRSL